MSDQQSGFMSNLYAYEPLREQNGFWKEALGTIGGALGSAIAGSSGVGIPANTAIATGGWAAGREIGIAVDNANTIVTNVQTFITEINDWRSWSSALGA